MYFKQLTNTIQMWLMNSKIPTKNLNYLIQIKMGR